VAVVRLVTPSTAVVPPVLLLVTAVVRGVLLGRRTILGSILLRMRRILLPDLHLRGLSCVVRVLGLGGIVWVLRLGCQLAIVGLGLGGDRGRGARWGIGCGNFSL